MVRMKLKLDVKKIKKIKESLGLSYQDIADMAGLKSRQHIYDYVKRASAAGAPVFAKAFKMKPKDLIC